MKNYKLFKKCLESTISKDEIRLNLNGVYFDPKEQQAVSTNGYAMTISKSLYEADFADKIVNFKNMSTIKREFLRYSSVIPKKSQHSEYVRIGENVNVKQKRAELKAYFIKDVGFEIAKDYTGEYEFAIDPKFLKPLIGYTLKVEYNGKLQPIMFTLEEDDSYYIVMPMKA